MDHNSYKTLNANKATVEKSWVVIDANAQVLGRVASQIAHVIKGKHKTSYTPNVDCGDHVIVINAEKVRMTGKKWTDRVIFTHSGYPGGQREHTPTLIRSKHPERLIDDDDGDGDALKDVDEVVCNQIQLAVAVA